MFNNNLSNKEKTFFFSLIDLSPPLTVGGPITLIVVCQPLKAHSEPRKKKACKEQHYLIRSFQKERVGANWKTL